MYLQQSLYGRSDVSWEEAAGSTVLELLRHLLGVWCTGHMALSQRVQDKVKSCSQQTTILHQAS